MRKLIFTSALFFISFQTAFCQSDSSVLKNAVSKLQTSINTNIVEKAYIHFDRPYYAAGDSVYFKAYVTLGERHELSKMSGILHVDLIDKNDMLMQSLTLQLNNGITNGDFILPDTLQKGIYRVRAYTNWMRNKGPAYFFDHYISVGSVNSIDQTASTTQAAQPAIQFFPEGGQMINDVSSKIAFKAIGANGLGINVKGVIIDNEKNEIAKFASNHLGMGAFDLIPEAGKTYKAKLTYGNGSQNIIDLPAAQAKGIVLAVNSSKPDKIFIEIRANRDYYKENINKDLNLIIYSGGSVNTVKTKLDNSVLGLTLPKLSFRTGILQITLLSQEGEPLSERLAFIQNNDLLNLSLTTDKMVYKTDQKVHLTLSSKTQDNVSLSGYFSLAVVDENKAPTDEIMESTILANVLLTSELKGYVEQPNYYFTNLTADTRNNLDVLMLTQGYRRFVWKELLHSNTVAAAYQPESSFSISGSVKSKAGVPLANKTLQLLAANGGDMLNQRTDANGNFTFPQLAYYNNSKFILKTESGTGKNQAVISVNADNAANVPEISPRNSVEIRYNEKADVMASVLVNKGQGLATANSSSYKTAIPHNDVTVATERDNYRTSNLSGSGHADQVIHNSQIVGTTTLSVALDGVARGIDFNNGIPYLKGNQKVSGMGIQVEPMLIIIDGNTSANIDVIDPNFVETVEVLKGANAAIYGIRGGGGVMVITTKQTSTRVISKEMAPGILSIIPKGFYKAREFYSPQYDSPGFTKTNADNRTTVYWAPNITTDKNGNATFDYFNADGKGPYRVIVEGIDDKGNLGRQVFKYKVE